ncbi:putative mannitol 1-phosphate dehydrogenase [Phaeomoniella chlamydospora]|uniref:Putative mannitol 1-phosphate dehydrogenase n=1 Tax=Phaeomoniella chlamydospora TaxID=158046 RepID=A0A0G2E760_PHACM|nr:putative mannitol 1-phosphate dehydrogenase [Phaeomoniella chlamydospora]
MVIYKIPSITAIKIEMGFENQRIAIIGGGLGGMAFANAAVHVGLNNIKLYEQAPDFTEVGAGVNITRNANRILDAYGLKDAMLWKSSRNPPCYMEYHNYRTGEYVGHIDEFGAPNSRQIHRAHLLDVLRQQIPKTALYTGKKLRLIEYKGEEYVLTFEDGSMSTADIVVGCDGIKSVVRQHMGINDNPIYSGQMVYRGYVSYDDLSPDAAALFRKTVNFRGKQKHILTLPIGNDESKTSRVGVIGFITEPLENWTSESWLAKTSIDSLQEHVEGWAPPVQELIEGLRKYSPDGMMLKQTLYVREPVDKWFQCQGTCMAIESGIALATILRNWGTEDIASAFQFYRDTRKPRTDRITKTSYEAGKLASADVPDENVTANFNPSTLRERMRWIMEADILQEVYLKGAPFFKTPDGSEDSTKPVQASL